MNSKRSIGFLSELVFGATEAESEPWPEAELSFGGDLSVIAPDTVTAAPAELDELHGAIAAQMEALRSELYDSAPLTRSASASASDSDSGSESEPESDDAALAATPDRSNRLPEEGDYSIVYKGCEADKIQFFRNVAPVSPASDASSDVSSSTASSSMASSPSAADSASYGYDSVGLEASIMRGRALEQPLDSDSVASTRFQDVALALPASHPADVDETEEESESDDDAEACDGDDDVMYLLSRASKLHAAVRDTDFTPSKTKMRESLRSRPASLRKAPLDFASSDEVMELQMLEDAVSQLSKEVKTASKREQESISAEAQAEITSLRSQLFEARKDLADRRKSRAARNEELVSLRATVSQLKSTLKSRELRSLTAEMEAKQGWVGSVSGMTGSVSKLMQTAQANIASLEEQIETVKSQKEREKLEIVVEQMRLERERADLQTRMESTVSELGTKNAELARKADELEARNRNLERQHLEVEKELREQLADLYTERSRALDTVAALESKLSKTSQAWDLQRVRLETQITELQTQLEVLRLKKSNMEQVYTRQLTETSTAAESAQSMTRELQDENNALADALLASARDQVIKATEAAEAVAEVEALRAQLAAKETELVAQIAALEAQLQSADNAIVRLESQASSAQNEASATIAELEAQITMLQEALDEKEAAEAAQAAHIRALLAELQCNAALADQPGAELDDQLLSSAKHHIKVAMERAKTEHALSKRDRMIEALRNQLDEVTSRYATERAVIQAGMDSMRATLLQYARDAAAAQSEHKAELSEALEAKAKLESHVEHLKAKVSRVRRQSSALDASNALDAYHQVVAKERIHAELVGAPSSPLRGSPMRNRMMAARAAAAPATPNNENVFVVAGSPGIRTPASASKRHTPSRAAASPLTPSQANNLAWYDARLELQKAALQDAINQRYASGLSPLRKPTPSRAPASSASSSSFSSLATDSAVSSYSPASTASSPANNSASYSPYSPYSPYSLASSSYAAASFGYGRPPFAPRILGQW
ncbi:uncharacterized protein AMSG_03491 [Thecamonas trahens ATCC 50062]|uniref:Uncharacterized protein n=1 Tax=Thecamonas trahens ATCC 50062 TaxID=461836 RepID=A0A0L0D405_THETB|nr:hypothetical protein AMSG_03491 [Thecamonas trahens ATCC 50062]KNC47067.1 hypothetical protein AMSG_03491 [Thecamonas trahens ATCC 50062]|eukprot:XP_013759847.1 hypothetical protein AMSG_03491 [Thecamonas trahens ATCC 50062]